MISDKERDALKAAAHAGRERAPQLPVDNSELLLAAERAGRERAVVAPSQLGYNPALKEKEVAQRAGKSPNLLCFIEQFPLAMVAIAECHDYERGPLVKGDYRPSLLRHLFGLVGIGEEEESPLIHKKKAAWNAIADLEITLRQARDGKKGT